MQTELISATGAMKLLNMRPGTFYNVLEKRGIQKIIPLGNAKKGYYRKADIDAIKDEQTRFQEQYKIVGG